MSFANSASLVARVKRELPPAAPLPAALQTLACRLWPLGYLERCRERYGRSFTVYPIDMPPLVFLCDPQDIRALLAASPAALHAGAGGSVVAPLFGESSFVLREEGEHRCGRASVLPAFQRKAIAEQAEMVDALVEREVASWPRDAPFSIHPGLGALTLRIVLRVVFGDGGRLLEELHAQMLSMLSAMATPLLQEPRLRFLPGWGGVWKRLMQQREAVDGLIFALVRARRRSVDMGGDVLGLLLGARNPDGSRMSDRQVRDNVVSVLIAGHETTAAELAWAFQLLAHNPDVQDRLAAELAADPFAAYLDATVHEVLRRRPVFLFAAPRAVVRPIEIGGHSYRPPVRLLACIYLLHHDPALYPEPHEFRPERFLQAPPIPRAWLPWGGGRRRCLGQHLAMLQMQAVLRTALKARRVLPAGPRMEHAHWRTVLVAPHRGSRVVLCARGKRVQWRRAPRFERATV
jgi:cytochrome P450